MKSHPAAVCRWEKRTVMKYKRKPSKTFQRVEAEAQAVDEAMGRLGSAKAVFEKNRTEVALEVGAILSTAQRKLSRYGDGVFIRWVQERLSLQKTTAYKWLRLHEHFGDCPQCVQNIDVSGLYILSVDSGPAHRQVLADALASAQKGRRVKRRSVIQMLQATGIQRSAKGGTKSMFLKCRVTLPRFKSSEVFG